MASTIAFAEPVTACGAVTFIAYVAKTVSATFHTRSTVAAPAGSVGTTTKRYCRPSPFSPTVAGTSTVVEPTRKRA